ncbi:unnamed protein product, partial [marine sediment metagenome]
MKRVLVVAALALLLVSVIGLGLTKTDYRVYFVNT